MRRQHQDYEDAKSAFHAAVKDGRAPWLVQKMLEDPDPAEVVYEEGKKLLGGDTASDGSEELKAKIAALEAELESAKSGTPAVKKAPAKPIPKSIAAARGSGNGVTKAWSGPRSSKEIYD
jgi:hypothetical protein